MTAQDWIVSISHGDGLAGTATGRRRAVVGPARASTIEAVLHLAEVSEEVRAEIRADAQVRAFVEGSLDPEASGYFTHSPVGMSWRWVICIGSVHAVLR